jgi:pimeloyl-ACP methyl ester carboxylesterase
MEQFRRAELVFDVRDSGPADGPVVMLLHGAPQSNSSWDAVVPRLTARGYRCLAPNQRGYSPGARPARRRDYRLSELVDDVVALTDACGAEENPSGRSRFWWRGGVGFRGTASEPSHDAGDAVDAASHRAPASDADKSTGSGVLVRVFLPVAPLTRVVLHGRNGKAARLSRFLQAGGQSPAAADRDARAMGEPGAFTAAINWYRAAPLSRRVGTVAVPTMFVWSDGDKYLLGKAAHNTGHYVTGEYRFEILHGVSHWMPDQEPNTVAGLLLDWFTAHPSA